MKKIVLRYGLYATLLIVTVSAFNLLVLTKIAGQAGQEIAGYLTIFLSTLFVFLGIRQYRDVENGGVLGFWEGMKIGLLIVLIPSIFFGLFDLLYTEVINPGWMQEYYSQYMEKIKNTLPPDQLADALKKAAAEKELFSNPLIQFLLMAATVFIIGIIVTIISAVSLKRKAPAYKNS